MVVRVRGSLAACLISSNARGIFVGGFGKPGAIVFRVRLRHGELTLCEDM
jgi:hypothetical protein